MENLKQFAEDYRKRRQALESRGGDYLKGIAWTGGDFVPLPKATIPLEDQGFQRGDQCYDVPAVWDGRFFRLDDHLDRLEASCEKLRMRLPIPRHALRRLLIDMVQTAGYEDAYVEIFVTRGLEFIRFVSAEDAKNAIYAMALPYLWIMEPERQAEGGHACLTRGTRRTPPGAMDPTIKNLQWGDLIRGLFEAEELNAEYPILPDGDGLVTEGFGYNVVIVKDNVLHTPERGVLHGVTRRTVAEIAQRRGIAFRCEHVPVTALYAADEIFMTSTAGGVMPLTRLDSRPVGNGQVGPVTRAIWQDYWDLHYSDAYSFPLEYGHTSN